MAYLIRRATEVDIESVLALRREAERWLADRGIRQWTPDYAEDVHPRWVDAIRRGISWVLIDTEGLLVGHVALDHEPDTDFWLPEDHPEDGLYLGKMTVARDLAGRGVGDAILNWASRQAAEARRKWLRLECRRDNHKLQQYYLDRGFQHVRTARPAARRRTESGALFQRPAGLEHITPGVPRVELTRR